MKCEKCGAENDIGAVYCEYCGCTLPVEEENVEENVQVEKEAVTAEVPARTLKTNYSLLKYILLGIITLGIYDIVVICSMGNSINTAATRYDGKKTMHHFAALILGLITCGIVLLVWYHKFSNRVGAELTRRNLDYTFNAGTFWLWNVLGVLILVGPFIYIYKLCQAMNMINEDYNKRG